MLRRFLLLCRIDTERSIGIPRRGYFIKNETSMRLCYKRNCRLKYIVLPTPLEVAKFLKKNGVVQWYSCKDDYDVKMFRRDFDTTIGRNHQPVQKPKLVEVTWSEIELTPNQVQTFAARYELQHNKEIKRFVRQLFQAA
jgi:hypothetical protein